jgi:hypothetical protein
MFQPLAQPALAREIHVLAFLTSQQNVREADSGTVSCRDDQDFQVGLIPKEE